VPKIKKSYILLIQAQPGDLAKKLLAKLLSVEVVVDKVREIYILEKTRIHLDQVKLLGTFTELEQPTPDEAGEIQNSRKLLANLCMKLGVKEEDLEALSYADLLLRKSKVIQNKKGKFKESHRLSHEIVKIRHFSDIEYLFRDDLISDLFLKTGS